MYLSLGVICKNRRLVNQKQKPLQQILTYLLYPKDKITKSHFYSKNVTVTDVSIKKRQTRMNLYSSGAKNKEEAFPYSQNEMSTKLLLYQIKEEISDLIS